MTPYTKEEIEYFNGFSAGFDFVLHEIEKYRKQFDGPSNEFLYDLLAHHKMQDKKTN